MKETLYGISSSSILGNFLKYFYVYIKVILLIIYVRIKLKELDNTIVKGKIYL